MGGESGGSVNQDREGREEHGRLFWASLVVGWTAIGFGVVSILDHAGATQPLAFTAYLLGALAAHDFVLIPVVLGFGIVVGRRIPERVRGPFLAAMVVSGVLVLASYPALRGFGRLVDNPSLLPRDYAAGLSLVLSVVWAATAVLVAGRIRRGRQTRSTADHDSGGTIPGQANEAS
jgi:hypothetical protein